METARKGKYFTLQNVPSIRSYISDRQGNNFQGAWPNIATTSKNRPDNSHDESHNLNDDLNLTILQKNIKAAATRRYHENKWIYKLKTLAPHCLNTEIGDYAKEMCNFYQFSNELYHKFQYYIHMLMKNITDFGLN